MLVIFDFLRFSGRIAKNTFAASVENIRRLRTVLPSISTGKLTRQGAFGWEVMTTLQWVNCGSLSFLAMRGTMRQDAGKRKSIDYRMITLTLE